MKETALVTTLFSKPLYEIKLDLTEKEIKNLINTKFSFLTEVKNGYQSEDKFILNKKNNSSIKHKVMLHAKNYFYNVCNVEDSVTLYMKNSWVMKHEKTNFAQSHTHQNSLFTCVLYLKNTKDTGDLILTRSYTDFLFQFDFDLPMKKFNLINAKSFRIKPYDGLLVFFPSHIQHGTSENLSNEYRYVMAADFFIRGKIGKGPFSVNIK